MEVFLSVRSSLRPRCANTCVLKELNYKSFTSGRKMVRGQLFGRVSGQRMIFLSMLFTCQEERVTSGLICVSMCGLFLKSGLRDVSVVFVCLFGCWLVVP